MTVEELPAYLQSIATRVAADGAEPAVTSMAQTFESAVKRTLSLQTRGATSFRPSGERGQPPAMRSGFLRASVAMAEGASSGVTAEASVAPHTIYAAVQEWGHVMHARPNG